MRIRLNDVYEELLDNDIYSAIDITNKLEIDTQFAYIPEHGYHHYEIDILINVGDKIEDVKKRYNL